MKLLLAMAITGALLAAVFLVPIAGHTAWQRAESRGYPEAAARAMSNGAHAAVKWAEDKQAHHEPADATPIRKPVRREIAKSAPQPLRSPYLDAHRPTAPEAPSAAHDHIVAAPPEEKLSEGDKHSLDKLIANAGKK